MPFASLPVNLHASSGGTVSVGPGSGDAERAGRPVRDVTRMGTE